MKWLDTLERRLRPYAIPNLIQYVVIGQIIVYAVTMLVRADIVSLLTLSRAGLGAGQVWRLVTFVFVPDDYRLLYFALGCYFDWMVGTALEREWGAGWFNLYYLAGMAGAWLACLLTGYSSAYCLSLSLFLAFAAQFPHVRLLVMWVLPVEAKWVGVAAAVLWAYNFLLASAAGKLALVVGMLGFVLFFGPGVWRSGKAWYRREQWKRKNRGNWR